MAQKNQIDRAIIYLVSELRKYIPAQPEVVVMGNIASMESEDQSERIKDKIVVSLINIQEETTLKNLKNFQMDNNKVRYFDHPVHLNLYILISANFGNDKYETGLNHLSKVIEYFQSHRIISPELTPVNEDDDTSKKLELNMDLLSLTFEQVNYVWGSLGGKQVPFVLYKCRLVVISADKQQKGGGIIEEIKVDDASI